MRRREAQAARDFPPIGRFVTVEGRRVHAVIEGLGPDLVLLHGASGNAREFTFGLIDRLKADFRVTAFDRPGLGWSDALPDGDDPRAQARLLQAAARQLGLERPMVLGQSYGGAVALAWALSAPQTPALTLVSPAAMPWSGNLAPWYRITAHPVGARTVIPLVAAYASQRRVAATIEEIFAPEPVPAGYAAHIGAALALRPATLRENVRQVNGLLPHIRAMARLYPRLALPVELLHGSADTIVPAEVHAEPLARLLPAAVLTRLPGAGHMPHHTRPDAVVAAIHRAAARAGLH